MICVSHKNLKFLKICTSSNLDSTIVAWDSLSILELFSYTNAPEEDTGVFGCG